MMRKAFTLLEVMVAVVLISLGSAVVSVRMYKAIQKKKFHTQLERLRTRLTVSQKLAVASQTDWSACFKKEAHGWVFEVFCDEMEHKKLPPLMLSEIEIFLDQKKVDGLTFNFFSSGHVLPQGTLKFVRDTQNVEWETTEIFLKEEGKKSERVFTK
jgi:prepilin-type N-terminal cleavage/methylation domain-containing protein